MKISNLHKTKKVVFVFLLAFLLNFKVECSDIDSGCCDQDLVDTLKANTRKAMPNIFGFLSLSLGSSSFLKSVSTQAGQAIGLTGSSIGMASVLLNIYNFYIDIDQIKGFTHKSLNTLSILSNLASASLGYASVGCTDPDDKNALGVASLIAGASGLLFKGIDLFFMTSPQHDYKHRKACRLARQSTSEAVGDVELGAEKGLHYKVVDKVDAEKK